MDPDPIGEAASRFRQAEGALREVIDAAGSLRTAQDDLNTAAQSLDAGERVLRDSGDAVYQLASELKEIARELATGVDILKKAGVEELASRQKAIQTEQSSLAGRVTTAVVLAGLGAIFAAATAILTLVK